MNDPTPPEPMQPVAPTGDGPQHPAVEPVHSIAFKPAHESEKRKSAARHPKLRAWALAGLLALLFAAGGWLMHHLHHRPVVSQPASPPLPAPETTAAANLEATPPPGVSGEPEPSTPPAPTEPAVEMSETPADPVSDDETAFRAPRPGPVTERAADKAGEPPAPSRKRFRDLLSRGLTALHGGQHRQAHDLLLEAASVDPGSDAVREALHQADQALKLAQLDRLQRLATAAERDLQWQKARDLYLAALTIDPNVGFALRGRQRTMDRITIARRIDFYLTQPETLFNDRHLENAVQLLLDAGQVAPRDPALAASLNELDQLVTAAQTPVRVTITSDNRTDVAVYRVGRLGRFEAHDLHLRPGAYTVVGVRDGYRDVRLSVTAKPGAGPLTVRVVCNEKIH